MLLLQKGAIFPVSFVYRVSVSINRKRKKERERDKKRQRERGGLNESIK